MTVAPAPGRIREITSLANPLIKDIRLLDKKRHRDDTGRFVAEGMKLVIDAMDQGWTLATLLHARSARDNTGVSQIVQRAVANGTDVIIVPEKLLAAITRRDNPQTVIGVFEKRLCETRRIKPAGNDVWIALDRVRDPGNLGTIIRTADAAGASGIILVGECTDPFATETVRATMGSIFSVPVARMTTDAFISFAGQWPGRVVGTHLAGAVDFRAPDYSAAPVMLIMGNEQSGMPDALVACCTDLVRIPQAGGADSLNLAIATALCIYEVRRHALTLETRE